MRPQIFGLRNEIQNFNFRQVVFVQVLALCYAPANDYVEIKAYLILMIKFVNNKVKFEPLTKNRIKEKKMNSHMLNLKWS